MNMGFQRKGKLAREVTIRECHWLDEDLPEGKVVHEYFECTYGCITESGIAVSDKPGRPPFTRFHAMRSCGDRKFSRF